MKLRCPDKPSCLHTCQGLVPGPDAVIFKQLYVKFFFGNPILFAACTSTFSKLCKRRIQWHVEECSVALLCN
jgi:hypothetical protein